MRLVLFALSLCALSSSLPAHAERAVILVRHAEKMNDKDKDPELSILGEDRALSFTKVLRGTKVDAIFVTELRRTQATAQPLAEQRGLKPIVVKAGDNDELIKQIRALPKDAVVVVVGHSNTLPEIMQKLGVTDKVSIREDDYDRLFIVTPKPSGGVGLLELAFGS